MSVLLVGNGPYLNRGCEAIVRGTAVVLRAAFGEDVRIVHASTSTAVPPEQVERQNREETDPAISHISIPQNPRRGSRAWLTWQVHRRTRLDVPGPYRALDGPLSEASVMLQVGGDNYSLDYGFPWPLMELDRHAKRRGVPVVLWGASVGPFDARPDVAGEMHRHLTELSAITAREDRSVSYLERHGAGARSHRVSDPAFLMEPEEPGAVGVDPDGAVGLNFSPLMARWATGGDLGAWAERCTEIVAAVAGATGRRILLVPHVTAPHDDDLELLRDVRSRAAGRGVEVECLDGGLRAAQIKAVIGRLACFAGARTHSTIAAMSTGVPTVSFGYSVKAAGINEDVYGHADLCLEPGELEPSVAADRIARALAGGDSLRRRLEERLPDVRRRAMAGAEVLRHVARPRGS
jgi:colanic acid/amylovoran biosynthesis protein